MPDKFRPRSYAIYWRQQELNLKASEIAPRDYDSRKGQIHQRYFTKMLQVTPQKQETFDAVAAKLNVEPEQILYSHKDSLEPADEAIKELLKLEKNSKLHAFLKSNVSSPEQKPVSWVYFLVSRPAELRNKTQRAAQEAADDEDWNEEDKAACKTVFRLIEQCEVPTWDLALDSIPADPTPHKTTTDATDKAKTRSGKPRLVEIIRRILEKSPITRKTLDEFNPDHIDPESDDRTVANVILASDTPWKFLYNCVNRDYESPVKSELDRTMPVLLNAIAPLCLSSEEFAALDRYLDPAIDDELFAEVGTRAALIARAAVGFVKGCPIDTRDADVCPSQREMIGGIAATPEFGAPKGNPKHSRNIVDAFRLGLVPLLDPVSEELGYVQAALSGKQEQDIYLVVLFPNKQSPTDLAALHEAFPELILLQSNVEKEPHEHEIVRSRFRDIRKWFDSETVRM